MRIQNRKFFIILLFVFSNFKIFAQLGFSEQRTIKEQGNYYEREIKDGSILLYYKSSVIDQGKTYPEIVLYKIDQKSNICTLEMYSSSINTVNIYINHLNKMGKQVDVRTWENLKNNSIYELTTEGNIASISHYFKSNQSVREGVNSSTDLTTISKELDDCKSENQSLVAQIDFLKRNNSDLINNMGEMTMLSEKAAKNVEKAVAALKEKDAKILLLQEALIKKDSVTNEYIRKLENNQKK